MAVSGVHECLLSQQDQFEWHLTSKNILSRVLVVEAALKNLIILNMFGFIITVVAAVDATAT